MKLCMAFIVRSIFLDRGLKIGITISFYFLNTISKNK